MKVNFGKYRYFSPADTAQVITRARDFLYPYKDYEEQTEDKYKISDFLAKIPFFSDVCELLNILYPTKRDVIIHDHDVWGLDNTLAHIIYPALLEMKKDKQGVPYVDDEDYPGDILIPDDVDDSDLEYKGLQIKWEFVLDEMIYAFRTIRDEGDLLVEGVEIDYDRITNGLRLFGKYYRSLWT